MISFDYDAIIAGAGAAGLMAAIHAAERGRRVLLLENGKKPGVKILMSGGTRCGEILRNELRHDRDDEFADRWAKVVENCSRTFGAPSCQSSKKPGHPQAGGYAYLTPSSTTDTQSSGSVGSIISKQAGSYSTGSPRSLRSRNQSASIPRTSYSAPGVSQR
ncbi:hypothetical protein GobsT_75590 [Gemmata obscuriglobus]|uniref:FAD-dependent oxidoreductase n=1 Tax=Gemmata obscuriglobus TaxID=114 RepID=UPI000A964285|nr:hypothetical protein GobsT_75590 [Gemmata obscuriglobus]VTS12058.1 Membrane protein OS=Pantoea agglomerans Tx10 GN=L584_11020 PE=4 SV=1: HI0933_like [Gemmata obscuriglobus UQM 2246]